MFSPKSQRFGKTTTNIRWKKKTSSAAVPLRPGAPGKGSCKGGACFSFTLCLGDRVHFSKAHPAVAVSYVSPRATSVQRKDGKRAFFLAGNKQPSEKSLGNPKTTWSKRRSHGEKWGAAAAGVGADPFVPPGRESGVGSNNLQGTRSGQGERARKAPCKTQVDGRAWRWQQAGRDYLLVGVVGSEASKEDANREERTALPPAASSSLLCCCFFFERQCPKGDRFLRSPETVVVVVVEEQLPRCSRRPSKQGDGQGEETGVSLPRSGSESSDSLLWWKSRPSLLKPPFSMLSKAELRVTPRLDGCKPPLGSGCRMAGEEKRSVCAVRRKTVGEEEEEEEGRNKAPPKGSRSCSDRALPTSLAVRVQTFQRQPWIRLSPWVLLSAFLRAF